MSFNLALAEVDKLEKNTLHVDFATEESNKEVVGFAMGNVAGICASTSKIMSL